MRTKRMFAYAAFLSVVLMTTACSKEQAGGPEPGEALPVRFEVPVIEQTVEATKAAAEALTDGTTVRVVAYYHATANPQAANLCKEATYCLRDGKLIPCLVDENGAFTEFGGQDMELLPYVYDFYAISPALPLGDDKCSVNVPHGVDFATSVTANQTISGEKVQTLALTTLSRRCAKVTYVVKRADDFSTLTALNVSRLTIAGLPNTACSPIIGDIPAVETSAIYVIPGDAFIASDQTSASFCTFTLPTSGASRIYFDYELDCTIDGASSTITLEGSIGALKLDAGKSYTVTLTVKKQGGTVILTGWDSNDQPTDAGGWPL